MDLKLIKNLIDLIAKSEVNEVSIEEGEFKIKIKKAAEIKEASVIYQSPQMAMPQQVMQPVQASSPTSAPSTDSSTSESASNPNHITIKSPMVGTYYKASSPDAPAFVSAGQNVSKGDALCIIEAMKIMNEITSEHSGTIVKVLVDNAQPIEFDQPLFIIDPS